jgi:hypothetical protein
VPELSSKEEETNPANEVVLLYLVMGYSVSRIVMPENLKNQLYI